TVPEAKPENAAFDVFTGTVTKVDVWNGMTYFRLAAFADDGETDFVVVEGRTVVSDTIGLADLSAIKVDDIVTAYYVRPLMMTLQYPPRYDASVLLVRGADNPGGAFVGLVNKDGFASDRSVKLNVADGTPTTLQSSGAAYTGALTNRILIAYYTVETRSIPPQAIVEKIVVLDKLGLPIFVNDVRLFNAEAITKADGTVLVPLRAISEALNYTVTWDAAANQARIGVGHVVTLGSDEYAVGRAVPQKLEAKAELINDLTYVPVSFFTQIMGLTLDDSAGLVALAGKAAAAD
ncbi:MAG: copper amine oxidase N-terminal domain-containing protein, partial [Clostridiales bacterium]|nr:copper amine oxidase N-terminal domain-containing protein [Clostridiales bacterium]